MVTRPNLDNFVKVSKVKTQHAELNKNLKTKKMRTAFEK